MIIIHGDNLTQSRSRLGKIIDQVRQEKKDLIRLAAKSLSQASLETALGSQDLFGTAQVTIIEELHSLPTSNRKKDLIKTIAESQNSQVPPSVILWEKRSLTATMLKQFPTAKSEEFKTSNLMFKWLESLTGDRTNPTKQLTMLKEVIEKDGDVFALIMLARQIRMLIQAKDGVVKGPPFMVSKLKKQALSFQLDQLLKIHKRILKMDLDLKTSGSPLPLEYQLDQLLLNM